MKEIVIYYSREVTFSKTVKVSDKLAERVLKLDKEPALLQKEGERDSGEEDAEEVTSYVFKAGDVSTDDFTMITEDLTCAEDIYDMADEIKNIEINLK
jgi:hypothetical protein